MKKVNIKKILVIVILLGLIIFLFTKLGKKEEKKVVILDNIYEYGYQLNDNKTIYYKGLYKELKNILNQDNIKYEEYAKSVSKLFLSDFLNLENKVSINDIGGLDFIYPPFLEDFKKIAKSTIYASVENDFDNTRKQKLPKVTEVTINNVKEDKFTINNEEKDVFIVEASINYNEDMSYQKSAMLYLTRLDKKIYVVKMVNLDN